MVVVLVILVSQWRAWNPQGEWLQDTYPVSRLFLFAVWESPLRSAGVIKFFQFGGIKQCKFMVILKDFPYKNGIVWVGNIMTPVVGNVEVVNEPAELIEELGWACSAWKGEGFCPRFGTFFGTPPPHLPQKWVKQGADWLETSFLGCLEIFDSVSLNGIFQREDFFLCDLGVFVHRYHSFAREDVLVTHWHLQEQQFHLAIDIKLSFFLFPWCAPLWLVRLDICKFWWVEFLFEEDTSISIVTITTSWLFSNVLIFTTKWSNFEEHIFLGLKPSTRHIHLSCWYRLRLQLRHHFFWCLFSNIDTQHSHTWVEMH